MANIYEMQCSVAQKNINNFLRKTLKGNELRKTYYHLATCPDCKEVLLDEFSFYTTFNDLDIDLDFNYEKKLNEFMNNIKWQIINSDKKIIKKYRFISIIICVVFILLLVIALKVVY